MALTILLTDFTALVPEAKSLLCYSGSVVFIASVFSVVIKYENEAERWQDRQAFY